MVVIRLMGGLGNQMFQYAFGRMLSHSNDVHLQLDRSFLDHHEINMLHTPRNFELDVFNIKATIADNKTVASFRSLIAGRKAGFYINFPFFFNKKILKEHSFRFDRKVILQKGNIYAEGYWQCEKYFEQIENDIRREFTFKTDPSPENRLIAEKIRQQPSVSMHIRRGDMAALPSAHQFHGICIPEYYDAALNLLKEKVGSFNLFVFSDEPEYVRANFNLPEPFTIISHNTGKHSFEDMRLMSLCNHHIIANSSFSWWGAWLNPSKSKSVVAPRKWFAHSEIDTSDIIPLSWIQI